MEAQGGVNDDSNCSNALLAYTKILGGRNTCQCRKIKGNLGFDIAFRGYYGKRKILFGMSKY